MKTTNEINFEDHFHIRGTGITIWIFMNVYFWHNNYSIKFDNLVNWENISIVLVSNKYDLKVWCLKFVFRNWHFVLRVVHRILHIPSEN